MLRFAGRYVDLPPVFAPVPMLEWVSKIPHGDDDYGQLQEAEVGCGVALVTHGDAAEIVEESEHLLGQPAVLAELRMIGWRPA